MPDYIIQIVYFIGAFLLILGLKKMSSPTTAKSGLTWTGIGISITVLITYLHHEVTSNYMLITTAILVGGIIAYISARKAAVTDMPQMIALYNGMGGGSAAIIAATVLINLEPTPDIVKYFSVIAAVLGNISFSGSLTAYAKLKGLIKSSNRFPMHQWVNAFIFVVAATFGIAIVLNGDQFEITSLVLFFVLSLLFGTLMTLPIAENDMPVVISLFNTFTGLAVGLVGYVLSNPAIMIAGILVGSAGILLTRKMSASMSNSILNVFFGNDDGFDIVSGNTRNTNKTVKELNANDAAMMMAFAKNIIVIPGYGMAIAQAQHKLWDMSKLLKSNQVNIKFAIHPAAGRMPGHMNVLLAEADIPYDFIYDLDEINDQFERADVVLIIGANDIINPSARSDQNSPIFGMPILNADKAKNVIIVKRGKGTGFSDINNPLFYQENTGLIYGDAESVLNDVIINLKAI